MSAVSELGLEDWYLERFASGDVYVNPNSSSIAYVIGITDEPPTRRVDTLKVHPRRFAAADIDWDIDSRYRDKLISYTRQKYGEDKVAQIITFTQMKARTAVRDVSRVLGYDWALGDQIAKAMPPLIQGHDTPLKACLEFDPIYESGYKNAQGLRDMYASDKRVKEVVDISMDFEGLPKTTGIHAAGVVIGDQPLTEIIPLQRRYEKGEPLPITTQWSMGIVEDLGLLKMDFLALRNLDVIKDTLDMLDKPIDFFDDLPMDHPEVYQMLQKGDTIGVFQVESPQMRELMIRLKPTNSDDISAVLALYRPGPMAENMHNDYADRKNGRQNAIPFHEDAREILDETYQLAIYQEQIMKISQKFAGYSMSEADNLRKIIGKKLPDKMRAEKAKFVGGCVATGYEQEFSERLFAMIEGFASYSFNKCLTGETKVSTGGKNRYNTTWTLKEIYKRVKLDPLPPATAGRGATLFEGPCVKCGRTYSDPKGKYTRGLCRGCNAWRSKFMSGKFKILGQDTDGRIRPLPVRDIHYNGPKEVFELRLENGMTIKSTGNHKHMTPGGWRKLSTLSVGDILVTHAGCETKSGMSLKDMRTTSGPRKGEGHVYGAYGSANYGYVDGGSVLLKENSSRLPHGCAVCLSVSGRMEVAHLDGDRTNNDISNLKRLCVSCHKKHDYRFNGRRVAWGKGHLTGQSRIVSIDSAGVQDTYDLEMDHSGHNFVANGIVTHNSHSYSYGYITYWTAYLKVFHPIEYMTSLCSSVMKDNNKDKIALYLYEARKMGLTVEPPDVNESGVGYQATKTGIRVGLAQVSGIGPEFAAQVVANRPYVGVYDFVKKANPKSDALKCLAAAGALEAFGSRQGIDSVADNILNSMRKQKKKHYSNQDSLFGAEVLEEVVNVTIPTDEYGWHEKLEKEREYIGFYVSGHPLDDYTDQMTDTIVADLADLEPQGRADKPKKILCMATSADVKWTKKGEAMADVLLEDVSGSVLTVCFPRTWTGNQHIIKPGTVIYAWIRISTDSRDEEKKSYILSAAELVDQKKIQVDSNAIAGVYLPRGFSSSEEHMSKLKGVLLTHRGTTKVDAYVSRSAVVDLGNEYAVTPSENLKLDLIKLFKSFTSQLK